jgi:hypothetical protein
VGTALLPLVALLPAASDAVPTLALNTAKEYPTGIRLAVRLGAQGERAVGITSPKVGIRVPGTNLLRIPDALDKAAKVLTEVKNVAKLRMTPQMRDFLLFCRTNGYRFVLYTRQGTTLWPELQELVDSGEIEREYILGSF